MMTILFRQILMLLFMVLAAIGSAYAEGSEPPAAGLLTVNIKGILVEEGGQLIVSLYSGKDNWLKAERASARQTLPVVAASDIQIIFQELPLDREFAVQVVHDRNSNGELDFQWFPPKPKEGVGVSHNTFRMGPPDYAAAKFELQESAKTITIDMHY